MDTFNIVCACIDVFTCFSRNIKSEDMNMIKTEITKVLKGGNFRNRYNQVPHLA